MNSWQRVNRLIEHRIRSVADGGDVLRILEAGCGRKWQFDLSDIEATITGIDLDASALTHRKEVMRDLDATVVGDLRAARFDDQSFDVIYCSFVLEHVPGVEAVLENFAAWLHPGGLAIIKIPDRRSVYGFLTRMTPHRFHVFYKRYFTPLGRRAGTPGFGPYRTYYDKALAQPMLDRLCASFGLRRVETVGFGDLPRYQRLLAKLISLLSLNYLTADHTNVLHIFRRDG